MDEYVAPFPSAALFAEVLSEESNWYTLGVFLDVPVQCMDDIVRNHRGESCCRCLIEVYKCLQYRNLTCTWEHIATCLRKMGNHGLADKIHSRHIRPSLLRCSTTSPSSAESESGKPQVLKVWDDKINVIAEEFENLRERFDLLIMRVQRTFEESTVNVEDVRRLIEGKCGEITLQSATDERAAQLGEVFKWLSKRCSFLQYRVLVYLVDNLLEENLVLREEVSKFKKAVDNFKSSTQMAQFLHLVKEKQDIASNEKLVQLKVREFWSKFTMKQFETVVNYSLIDYTGISVSRIQVGEGCICVSWIIPDHIDSSKLVHEPLPSEFVKIIGVIYLHIGDDVIYSFEEEGCETIEAAMLQAIELKNTQAIELLLAMGCSPEVATYNEGHAVTNIVNIREKLADSRSTSGGDVDHVCVLGHNEHVEAVADPSTEYKCSSCISNKEVVKKLHQENDSLHYSIKKKDTEISELAERLNEKDALLKGKESVVIEENRKKLIMKDAEISSLHEKNQSLMKELIAEKEASLDFATAHVPVLSFIHSKDIVYPPVAILMSNFNEKKKTEREWFSPSFYSHPKGYKMCLKVVASNGQDPRAGTHVSVYVHIMAGEFDDKLSWPFMAEIELELLNRQADENHTSFSATFDESSREEATGRVFRACLTESGMAAWVGEGTDKLLHLDFNPGTGTEYLKDDSLIFRCKKVTMVSAPQKPVSTHSQDPSTQPSVHDMPASSFKPVEFTLRHFSKSKSNDKFCVFPFDSHDKGYRLVLVVYPNGVRPYNGKSISLFVFLAKGDFDKKLVFPFRGVIHVQAVDQKGKNHVQFPVHFDEGNDPKGSRGARVTIWDSFWDEIPLLPAKRSKGWGISNFLDHGLLQHNKRLGTEYLKNDEIVFRIAKVEVLSH